MPADPERPLHEELSHLRSDVDHLTWADAAAIRRRGDRRGRNHAIAGVTTTLAVLGVVGLGLVGGPNLMSDNSEVAGIPLEVPPAATETSPAPTSDSPTSAPETGEQPTPEDTSEQEREEPPSPREEPTKTATDEPTTKTPTKEQKTEEASPKETTPDRTPDEEKTDSPSPSPSDPTSTSSAISAIDSATLLLPAKDMYPVSDDTESSWSATGTMGSEAGPISRCQEQKLTALGAAEVAQRDYTWGTDKVTGANVVGVFKNADQAAGAYERLTVEIGSCAPGEPTPVEVAEGAARWWLVQAKQTSGEGNNENAGGAEVIGLVLRGPAVSLVVMRQQGMDYTDDPSPTLVAAWERLG